MSAAIQKFLSKPDMVCFALAVISASALAVAFMAEFIFKMEPCVLCVYQRVPFVLVAFFGLTGYAAQTRNPQITFGALSLSAVVMALDTLIAFYHSGVERHWWKSFLEGCAVPEMEGNITDVLAQIEARTDSVPCDAIPWADPVLGLSMANYNVMLCAALSATAFYAAYLIKRPIAKQSR
jgi:disulfide bond formation protein DsbB